MSDAFALLALPFVAALCLVGIHAYFGIQVLRRNVIFVDLALAQMAALGATVAFMLGHPALGAATYAYSFGFTLLAALLLAFARTWSGRIPQEALIGVIYVIAAATALLLIDRAPQGAEHLKQILTGTILTVGWGDLALIGPLYLAVACVHWLLRKSPLVTADSGWRWEFVFYASFGLVVTSSVSLAGVLLVFSFLIIPAAIGVLYAERLSRQLLIGWISGAAASGMGLAASYAWDLPTGATMVCAFGVGLTLAGVTHPFARGGRRARAARQMLTVARWCASLALFGSAAWMMVAPRADQPLLDAAELTLPTLRGLYMNSSEEGLYRDAAAYAERYLRDAERLNEREARGRFDTKPLDDYELARISSFIKSYNEMRRGEEFVMREVRNRARARARWIAGVPAIVLALLLAPGFFTRVRSMLRNKRSQAVPIHVPTAQ
jgi:zinc/manganese transport system permease protein